jgi:hypothetical protein
MEHIFVKENIGLDRDKRPTLGRKSVAPYGLQKRKWNELGRYSFGVPD